MKQSTLVRTIAVLGVCALLLGTILPILSGF